MNREEQAHFTVVKRLAESGQTGMGYASVMFVYALTAGRKSASFIERLQRHDITSALERDGEVVCVIDINPLQHRYIHRDHVTRVGAWEDQMDREVFGDEG